MLIVCINTNVNISFSNIIIIKFSEDININYYK